MNLHELIRAVAVIANRDGVNFRGLRVMECKKRRTELEILTSNQPILKNSGKPHEFSHRTIVLTPGEGPKSGRVAMDGKSKDEQAQALWSCLWPLIWGLPKDKKTIVGIHQTEANELLFCVVRDAAAKAA